MPWVVLAAAGLVIVALLRQVAVLRQRLRTRPASSDEADRQTREWYHTAMRFRMIFNHASHVMVLLAPDGTVLEANGACLTLAGVLQDEALGQRLWDVPSYGVAGLREALEQAVASKLRASFEAELPTREERPVRLRFGVTPVLDDRGCVEFVIVEGTALVRS